MERTPGAYEDGQRASPSSYCMLKDSRGGCSLSSAGLWRCWSLSQVTLGETWGSHSGKITSPPQGWKGIKRAAPLKRLHIITSYEAQWVTLRFKMHDGKECKNMQSCVMLTQVAESVIDGHDLLLWSVCVTKHRTLTTRWSRTDWMTLSCLLTSCA